MEVSPRGEGINFSDIYPGPISDSKPTEKCGAVYFVESEHEIMRYRRFLIQGLCAVRSMTFNRPKQKEIDQLAKTNVATNFDMAAS